MDGYNLQADVHIKSRSEESDINLYQSYIMMWQQAPSGHFPLKKANISCFFLACVLTRMYMCKQCACVHVCMCVFL